MVCLIYHLVKSNLYIVRLVKYTTSKVELFQNFDLFQNWIIKNEIKQLSTVLEVRSIFENLKVDLEVAVLLYFLHCIK